MKHEKFIVIDTETTNGFDDPLCYDVGFIVTDKTGKIFEEFSFVVKEIFFNDSLMAEAYYADKRSQYLKEIRTGKRTVKKFFEVKKIFNSVSRKHKIMKVFAHNAKFDYSALSTTLRYLTNSKYRFFFNYGQAIWCTLKMAKETFAKDPKYVEFCKRNNFVTLHKEPRLTAEILYRYIIDDVDFIEEHTGLEDVKIEKEIAKEILKKKPWIDGRLWKNYEDRFEIEKQLVW